MALIFFGLSLSHRNYPKIKFTLAFLRELTVLRYDLTGNAKDKVIISSS
jgi:hypothetical protein